MSLLVGLLERAGLLAIDDAEVEAAIAAAATVVAACAAGYADRVEPGQAAGLVAARPTADHRGSRVRWRAVARRWKTQINENSNSAAAAEELPEATHNTVVGYDQPE